MRAAGCKQKSQKMHPVDKQAVILNRPRKFQDFCILPDWENRHPIDLTVHRISAFQSVTDPKSSENNRGLIQLLQGKGHPSLTV